MMKHGFSVLAAAAAISAAMAVTALAGQWTQDASGWKYTKDDGTDYTSSWQWIDGNGDGMAESYYFGADGYVLVSTITPDRYSVDSNGAWTVNGYVQQKNVATGEIKSVVSTSAVDPISLIDLKPVDKSGYTKYEAKKTMEGETFTNGFYLHSSRWARYFTNQKYGTLEMTVAPMEGTAEGAGTVISVYGDKEALLYRSEKITKDTPAQTITVNVSGQSYIKIVNSQAGDASKGVYVLFDKAVLK